jgi:DNA polymerase-3 subunit alpha
MGQKAHVLYADRKNGREPVRPLHKELATALEPILGETYGLIVYQEQVIEIARQLAGYTMGGADLLRKAMGKKILAVLDKERGKFTDGMRANGFSDEAITTLWEILIPFASYAFNRAHSAAYGLIAYWTAYLKCHHPCEYLAALLTTTADNHDRARIYLAEARRLGITVLPPDVNHSRAEFTVEGTAIRTGLASVANVGAAAVADIIAGRPYADFHDFCRTAGKGAANTRTVESLIKAGAFDGLGHPRAGLAEICGPSLRGARERGKRTQFGQLDLFGGLVDGSLELRIPDTEWGSMERLAHEREMLGLYVSGHPLQGREEILADCTDIATALEMPDGQEVIVGGTVANLSRRYNSNGQPWVTLTLEDLAASIEVTVFARTYTKFGADLAEDAIIVLRGRISHRDGRVQFIADGAPALETAAT